MLFESYKRRDIPEELRYEALGELDSLPRDSHLEDSRYQVQRNLQYVHDIQRQTDLNRLLFTNPARLISMPLLLEVYLTNINLSLVDLKLHN